MSFWGLWSVRPNPSCKNFMNYTVSLITIYRISCRWCKMELKSKPKQDWNSTYICAIWGLRIYNFFNPFSLPIWVTFQFELCSIFSDIPLWVKFQYEWHSNYYYCLFRNEYIPQGNIIIYGHLKIFWMYYSLQPNIVWLNRCSDHYQSPCF